MTRVLGETQSGRSFWLVLLLAVALLVGVSTTAARADTAAAALAINRDLGALHVLTDRLRTAPPPRTPPPVHPALADGSGEYLRNASLRRIAALQRRLETLGESAAADRDGARSHGALAREAQLLHWLLLASDAPGPDAVGPTLQRMSVAWAALMRPVAADHDPAPSPPRILRGVPL